MTNRYFSLLIVGFLLITCKKQVPIEMPPAVPSVLLKDIVIPNLPSPYYHFEYDNTGKAIIASFASGFTNYQVLYSGGRITEMKNNIIVNKDRLLYSYDNAGRVSKVSYADSTGNVYANIYLAYNGQKLISLERERKLGSDFIIDKTLTMSYYPDGNLQQLNYQFPPINGQPGHIYMDRFEQYDNKINVDGFGLIHHEFFDHLVLLPGIQLQKNNPRRETRTGEANNYEVNYTYTYNNKNLPLTKTGDLIFTSGSDQGKRFQTQSAYSYYE